MPLFTFQKPYYTTKKPKKTGTAYDPYSLLLNKKDLIDQTYSDNWGNITDKERFNMINGVLTEALTNPNISPAEKGKILVQLGQNEKERQKFDLENKKIFASTKKQAEAYVQDVWLNFSKDKSYLRDPQGILSMVEDTVAKLESEKEEYDNTYLIELQDAGVPQDMINTAKEISDYLGQQIEFYRGVKTKPSAYGVELETQNGLVNNLILKPNTQIDTDFAPLKLDEQTLFKWGGVQVYGNPDQDALNLTGQWKAVIGNNVFSGMKGTGMGMVFDPNESGVQSFDFNSLSNMSPYNYEKNQIFKAPSGTHYLLDTPTTLRAFADPEFLRMEGYNPSRAVALTDEEVSKIKQFYDVYNVPARSVLRKQQIQEQTNNASQSSVINKPAETLFSPLMSRWNIPLMTGIGFGKVASEAKKTILTMPKEFVKSTKWLFTPKKQPQYKDTEQIMQSKL